MPDINKYGFPEQDVLELELLDFITNVRLRTTPAVSGTEGRRALEIALEVVDQIRKNRERVEALLGTEANFSGLRSSRPLNRHKALASPFPAGQNKRVMIVAGEASGDMHGARLVRAMLSRNPALALLRHGWDRAGLGRGGDTLDAAKIAVVGVTEVISHLGDILAARKTLIQRMQSAPPALLILIDYPDFNLLLAAKAKKLGIPVFYYISPQVWAWRKGRTRKIGRLAERIGVILPFEKNFYARYGVTVDFVGHPLMDAVKTTMTGEEFREQYDIPSENTIIGLLPGSRRQGDPQPAP